MKGLHKATCGDDEEKMKRRLDEIVEREKMAKASMISSKFQRAVLRNRETLQRLRSAFDLAKHDDEKEKLKKKMAELEKRNEELADDIKRRKDDISNLTSLQEENYHLREINELLRTIQTNNEELYAMRSGVSPGVVPWPAQPANASSFPMATIVKE